MPELPEVETVARGLRAALMNRRMEDVVVLRASFARGEPLGVLPGAQVTAVLRAGKFLVLELRGANRWEWQLMLHLGMTGQLVFVPAATAPAPHTHVIFIVEGGRELHFRDPRRFGRLVLAAKPAAGFAPALHVAAGAEPLEVTVEDFIGLFRGRNAPIKNALLNQKLLRGVGNIYADESLHRAGIHPRARHVSPARLRRLRLALRQVLREAIAAGGSSISDYRSSEGEPGWFHLRHRVYGREGEPCLRCRTPIRRLVLAGRSAHFCPRCQR